jgi:O-antigen/teichoic acid export membrane protein
LKKKIELLKSSLFIKNVILTFSNKVLLLFVGLFTSIAIARYLGPEGRGLYATAAVFLGLGIQFGNLGLHSTNIYFSANNSQNGSLLFGNSILIGFFVGLVISLFSILGYIFFPNHNPIKGGLFFWTILSIPFSLTYLLLQNLLIGLNYIKEFNKIELLSKIVATILIVGFIILGLRSAESMMVVIFISAAYAFAHTYIFLKGIIFPKISLSFFIKHFNYGIKAYLAALFAFIQQKIIVYFVTQNSGVVETGYFSISQTLFDLSLIFPVTVASILFPKLSSSNSQLEKWEMTKKVLLIISSLMFVYIVVLYFASPWIINILYGDKFEASNSILKYLLPGLFFLSVVSVIMNFLASSGMPIIVIITPLFSCLFIFSASLIFKSSFNGIVAATINSIANFLSFFIIIIYFIQQKPKYNEQGFAQ